MHINYFTFLCRLIFMLLINSCNCNNRHDQINGSDPQQEYTPPTYQIQDTSVNPVINQGVPNIGNTCYLNSILHIFASNYYSYFKDKQGDALFESTKKIIESIRSENTTQDIIKSQAYDLLKVINQYTHNSYEIGKQKDISGIISLIQQAAGIPTIKLPSTIRKSLADEVRLLIVYKNVGTVESMQDLINHFFNFRSKKGITIDELSIENGILVVLRQMKSLDQKNDPLQEVKDFKILKVNTFKKEKDISCELISFIKHIGNSVASGHYIAYVKVDNQWIEYNDSKVQKISQEAAEQASKTARYLFYKTSVV